MSFMVSDDDLDAVMRAWARAVVDSTAVDAPSAIATASTSPSRRATRLVAPVLAATAVVGLVAAGLALAHTASNPPAAAVMSPSCPPHLTITTTGGSTETPPKIPLIPERIGAMTACSYTASEARNWRLIATTPLDQPVTQSVARSLAMNTVDGDDPNLCLAFLNFSTLIVRDQHGHTFPPINVNPGCDKVQLSNGTTTQYLARDDPALNAIENTVDTQAPTTTPR